METKAPYSLVAPVLLCVIDSDHRYLVSNVFYSQYMPMVLPFPFNNKGSIYRVTNIITDGVFDQAKYAEYGPPLLPLGFALSYGFAFATFSAVIVHTLRECLHLLSPIQQTLI